jgi:hypothetical protein
MPRGHEHAIYVDLHDPAPVLRGHLDDAAAPADPDIVVEAVEPAELPDRGADHGAGLLFVGHIGNERRGRAALRLNHRDGALGSIAIEIDNENLGAGAGKQDRRSTAVADAVICRTAAGDDCDFAGEAQIVALTDVRHLRPPKVPRQRGRGSG